MRWLRLALAASLVVGGPRVARAAEPGTEPVIEIAIDAADLPANRSELGDAVAARLDQLLAEQESLPEGAVLADDRRILIHLRPGPIPGADDLLIHVEVQLDGETIAESTTEPCLACSDETVTEKALALLEPLLPKLPVPVPVEPPAPMIVVANHAEEDPLPRRAPVDRRLLIPGGVLLGAGVVGAGVGLGLIAANERVLSPPDALDLEVVKYREVGIAVTAISGAALLAGTALLAFSLRKNRRSVSPLSWVVPP